MSSFADQLTTARKAAGMTQEQLADMVHVARNTISSWERGRTQPDLDTLRLSSAFSEGRAAVRVDGKYGYMNSSGHLAVEAKWDNPSPFKNGLAWVASGDTYSAIDPDGNIVVTCEKPKKEIKFIGDFHDGFAMVDDTNYRYGVINSSGKQVVKCQYRYMTDFLGGYAGATNEEKQCGIIDGNGHKLILKQISQLMIK